MLNDKPLYDECAEAYIALKNKQPEQIPDQIEEELKPKEIVDAERMVGNGHSWYNENFIRRHAGEETHKKFKEGNGRVTIPVTLNQDVKEPHPAVHQFLKSNGYDIQSNQHYVDGKAHKLEVSRGDPENGIPSTTKLREFSIGKVLEKHGAKDEIKKAFANDPARQSTKNNDYDIVLSHRPTDVYGMSTGRGWTSCAQLRKGESNYGGAAAKSMKQEINGHTHVAYLVPRGGNVDTDAVARINFKQHESIDSGHKTLISEKRVYGSAPDDFGKIAANEVEKLFPIKNEMYIKNSEVYNDSGRTIHVKEGHSMSGESLDNAWKRVAPNQKADLYDHIIPGTKYKSKKLNQLSSTVHSITNPTGNFVKDVENFKNAHYDLDDDMNRSLGRRSPQLAEAADKMAAQFDITNKDHTSAIMHMPEYSEARRHMHNALDRRFGSPVRTPEEYKQAQDVHEMLDKHSTSLISIAHDHQLGHDPIKTLMNADIIKNHSHFKKAHHSVAANNLNHGNYYDEVMRTEEEGNKNSAHVVAGAIEEFKDQYSDTIGGWGSVNRDKYRARIYHATKPEYRQQWADAVGEDANESIKTHQASIDEYENLFKDKKNV